MSKNNTVYIYAGARSFSTVAMNLADDDTGETSTSNIALYSDYCHITLTPVLSLLTPMFTALQGGA